MGGERLPYIARERDQQPEYEPTKAQQDVFAMGFGS